MHGEGTQINARLDAAANVQAGKEARLWIDTEKLQVFDAETGAEPHHRGVRGARPA